MSDQQLPAGWYWNSDHAQVYCRHGMGWGKCSACAVAGTSNQRSTRSGSLGPSHRQAPRSAVSGDSQEIESDSLSLAKRGCAPAVVIALVILWIVGSLMGTEAGDDTSDLGDFGSNTSECERNYASRDPSSAENDRDRFIENCEDGLELEAQVARCSELSDDAFLRCMTGEP
jgi:hypothetical protein